MVSSSHNPEGLYVKVCEWSPTLLTAGVDFEEGCCRLQRQHTLTTCLSGEGGVTAEGSLGGETPRVSWNLPWSLKWKVKLHMSSSHLPTGCLHFGSSTMGLVHVGLILLR